MSLEIEIPVAELKSVLPGLSKVVNRSSTLPVLGCVRASVENEQVKLRVTNLEDTATVNLGGRGSGNGAVLVALEELNKVAKNCAPTDTIRLCATKEGTVIN